jgi:hypothetical protein
MMSTSFTRRGLRDAHFYIAFYIQQKRSNDDDDERVREMNHVLNMNIFYI